MILFADYILELINLIKRSMKI